MFNFITKARERRMLDRATNQRTADLILRVRALEAENAHLRRKAREEKPAVTVTEPMPSAAAWNGLMNSPLGRAARGVGQIGGLALGERPPLAGSPF